MSRVWRDHPDLLEADIHALYGVDISGPARFTHSGPWLRRRVQALVHHPDSAVMGQLRVDIQMAVDRREAAEKQEQPIATE